MKSNHGVAIAFTMAVMLGMSLPATAGIVGTEQMVAQETRSQALATIDGFFAEENVASQLLDWGVAPETVKDRIDALSDAELQELAATMATDPAGGDALVVVGAVFVVLIILELIGVTNIFRSV
jgi:hypothetical protein